MIRTGVFSRRKFVGTSAQAAAAGLLAHSALPPSLLAAVASPWEPDGYNHKVVVRIYDPAVSANYTFGTPFYWRSFDAARLEAMLDAGIMQIAGASTPRLAWQKILPGVSGSSRIVVKANLNNTAREWKAAALNTSPAMMVALAKSLNQAGVRNENLTILDCSRSIPDEMKNDVLGAGSRRAAGRRPAARLRSNAGDALRRFLRHSPAGARRRLSDQLPPDEEARRRTDRRHEKLLRHEGRWQGHLRPWHARWMHGHQIRGIVTNQEIRKRLKLCINEAVLAANSPDTLDTWTFSDLFPDGRPSSLILSRNPFLQDVVGWDFVRAECSRFPCRVGPSITWLKNCAGYLPNWRVEAVESGVLVDGAPGMPPKDMRYDPALVEYISRRV